VMAERMDPNATLPLVPGAMVGISRVPAERRFVL